MKLSKSAHTRIVKLKCPSCGSLIRLNRVERNRNDAQWPDKPRIRSILVRCCSRSCFSRRSYAGIPCRGQTGTTRSPKLHSHTLCASRWSRMVKCACQPSVAAALSPSHTGSVDGWVLQLLAYAAFVIGSCSLTSGAIFAGAIRSPRTACLGVGHLCIRHPVEMPVAF